MICPVSVEKPQQPPSSRPSFYETLATETLRAVAIAHRHPMYDVLAACEYQPVREIDLCLDRQQPERFRDGAEAGGIYSGKRERLQNGTGQGQCWGDALSFSRHTHRAGRALR
jgi:hypothetical protein